MALVAPDGGSERYLGRLYGEGSKTVLPAEAHAKVLFRLVPGQDPKRMASLFEAFVKARLPADIAATIRLFPNSPATLIPSNSPFVTAGRQALQGEFGCEAVLVGTGGTLPVINHIKRALGIDSLPMAGRSRMTIRTAPTKSSNCAIWSAARAVMSACWMRFPGWGQRRAERPREPTHLNRMSRRAGAPGVLKWQRGSASVLAAPSRTSSIMTI
jgi:hypothetical protein